MKKILILTALALFLSACSNEWAQVDVNRNLSQEFIENNQALLEENLAALQEDPEDVTALFEVAYRYQQVGDYEDAVTYYEKVLALEPANLVTLNNMADMYEQAKDYDKAAEYIKKLYELSPASIEVIRDTVRILLEDGDVLNAQSALQNFESLTVAKNPDPDMQAFVDSLYEDIRNWKE